MDPDIAAALRRYGVDISTTIEAGLRTADDLAPVDFVRRENRVLVTDDTDFLALAAATSQHPGIIFLPPDD